MEKYDFYKHYNFCEDKQLVFSYHGKISSPILQGIVTILENRLTEYNEEKNSIRKTISIIIELTQNIQYYSLHKTINQDHEKGCGMLVVQQVEEGYQINAGNLVSQGKGEELLRFCNKLKKLNRKSLKDMYLKKLKENREADSDRAGIGLIHIMRKSNSQMEVKLHPIDETNVLLVFSVLVN